MTDLSPYWAFTPAGKAFDFDNPRPYMIDARALAWALSMENRWANNLHWPLSVAQHSLLVAWQLPAPSRIYGLLHDAPEAFTRDLSTPFKKWLAARGADVPALEGRILTEAVYPYFGLEPPNADIEVAVALADARALATEYRDVVRGKDDRWVPPAEPLRHPVKFRRQDQVEAEFLVALGGMLRDAGADPLAMGAVA